MTWNGKVSYPLGFSLLNLPRGTMQAWLACFTDGLVTGSCPAIRWYAPSLDLRFTMARLFHLTILTLLLAVAAGSLSAPATGSRKSERSIRDNPGADRRPANNIQTTEKRGSDFADDSRRHGDRPGRAR